MAERIPQSIAKRVVFRAYLASDHVSVATSKTIAITISKNGGAFGNPAAGATNATEISSGFYYFDLGTGDTGTAGPLAYRGAVATVDDVGDVFEVVNATNAGFTALPNAAAEAAGGLFTRGTGAGQINQDANGRIDTSLKAILGTTLTETAGQIAASFKKLFNVATPTAQADNLPLNTDYTAARAAKLDNLDATISSRGTGTALDAAGVRTAVGLGSANLDTQLSAIVGYIDTEVAAILAAVDTEVAAIKVQTDKLVFTAPGYVDVNVLKQNGATMYGTGTAADLWRGTP